MGFGAREPWVWILVQTAGHLVKSPASPSLYFLTQILQLKHSWEIWHIVQKTPNTVLPATR